MRLLGFPCLALAITACSNHSMHGDDEESYNCEAEARDDEFVVGIAKTGPSSLQFKLMSASPAPPARGDNTWLLQIDSTTGPLSNATVDVFPFMPDHQHGTPKPVTIEPATQPGQYTLTPINMWMPGLWEVTISATAGEPAVEDSVVFRFCIPS